MYFNKLNRKILKIWLSFENDCLIFYICKIMFEGFSCTKYFSTFFYKKCSFIEI